MLLYDEITEWMKAANTFFDAFFREGTMFYSGLCASDDDNHWLRDVSCDHVAYYGRTTLYWL